jgi:ubiquinone/menaquinone biosynthesis C-methylase UbiE
VIRKTGSAVRVECATLCGVDKVDYDGRLHTVYAEGRAISPATVAGWMRTFAGHVAARRPLAVLDLGSGTGRFTPALADTFGGPVYGVEPSAGMRRAAEQHPAVTYLDGAAERIPLPADSCDVVVLFLVLHHVRDRAAAVAEIARVLRARGRVLIRSVFSDRLPEVPYHRFFPRLVEIERDVFPTVEQVVEAFGQVGLRRLALDAVRVPLAGSLAECAARWRLRAISTFEHLTEDEIEQGFAALDAAVAEEINPQPVFGISDLLVLG